MINEKENPPPQAAGLRAVCGARSAKRAGRELAPISVVPITVKLTEDSKVIYQTIGQLAGSMCFSIRTILAADQGRTDGVTLEDALQITALESKTFGVR